MPDTQVTISIENLAPENGTNLTPLWVGFHNGEFDTYDRGAAVTTGLERLAEDGNAVVLGEEFDASGNGSEEGVVGGAPIAPGATVEQTFTLDSEADESQYFSYASMILPSNDFFVANGDPLAHQIFDDAGNFIGAEFFILGSQVLDAGTEVNDELEETTAFFGQSAPDTGTTENGVVTTAEGFIPNGRILSAAEFAAADFTAEGYQVAKVTVTADEIAVEPEPVPIPEETTAVTVSIENLAPETGTNLTPLWVGFHNGLFDIYNRGEAATPGLERIAEDGNAAVLGEEFDASGFGSEEGVVGGAPIAPGATVSQTFELDASDQESAYFSYASMILPSNDFFVANGDPLAHRIFDENGEFMGADFFIVGGDVLDAGTEVNDELAETTAFFSQSEPDTGTPENGVVTAAEGFIPNGRILSAEEFAAADFTAEGYQVARVRVTTGDVSTPKPPSDAPIGTALQESSGLEVFDLRNQTEAVTASFEISREAAFDNLLGFYRIENEIGQVLAGDGVTLISPEDDGYLQAALQQRLPDVLLEGGNNQLITSEAVLDPGQLLAPLLIANGTLDQLSDDNASNPEVYFAFTGANSDGVDHVRLLGNNTFGFEDLAGGGDQDFNDIIVRATFS